MADQTTSAPVTPAPQPVSQTTTQFAVPAPAPSGKPGCGYTILIVIVTIFLTIAAEIIGGFLVAGYFARTALKNIQKDLAPFVSPQGSSGTSATSAGATGGKVTLTADQKKLIESFGVNPADIPADFPVEKVACVENAVGSDRIQQILKGTATPGIMDLFKARGCLTN